MKIETDIEYKLSMTISQHGFCEKEHLSSLILRWLEFLSVLLNGNQSGMRFHHTIA